MCYPLAKLGGRSRIFIAVPMGDPGGAGLAPLRKSEIPLDGGLRKR